MIKYMASLSLGRVVLWCYLIWYLVTVYHYFDASPGIWLNAFGVSVIVGIALLLSVGSLRAWKDNQWQIFRLFMTPFCVSSFSALIKGKGYLLIFPPDGYVLGISVGSCLVFLSLVAGVKMVHGAVE